MCTIDQISNRLLPDSGEDFRESHGECIMSATLVEKITPDTNKRHDIGHRSESPKKSHILRWSLFSAAACVIVLGVLLGLIQKLLWMRELDYVGIFWTLLSVKWGMFAVALVFAFLYLWGNARLAAKRIDLSPSTVPPLRVTTMSPAGKVFAASDALRGISADLSPKALMWVSGVAVMFVSLAFAAAVSSQWDTYLRFRYGGSFGVTDPLYRVDLGFYLFRLPFYELLQGNLAFLTLNHYIAFTRKAYKLDGIQETAYPALSDLTPDVIARNQDTIQNIRLWDSRPLLQTYQQTQAIRLYYQFYNVDVDRYRLADGYHQVMLASRELASQLPSEAQTWVNETLQFTHGEGLVMNSVSNTTGGGLPQYLVDNVPAESQYG
jgi:uncharacterized membrane protein (UPF0182 family)